MNYFVVVRHVISTDGATDDLHFSPKFETMQAAEGWMVENKLSEGFSIKEIAYTAYGIFDATMDELSNLTWDEAVELDKNWRQEKNPGISPIFQWSVLHKQLPQFRQRWEEGDSKALFQAMASCGSVGLPLPRWCTVALYKASYTVNKGDLASWDDAFGKPRKGRKIVALKKEHKDKISAVMAVLDLMEAEHPPTLTEAIESVANQYSLGTKLLERWYYEFLGEYPTTEYIGPDGPFSDLWAIRKNSR